MQEQKPQSSNNYKSEPLKEDSSSQPYTPQIPSSPPQPSDLSQILNQDKDQRFSKTDLVAILDKAWLLNEAEKTYEERQKAIAEEIPNGQEHMLPLSYLYHRAECLGIPKEQVNKVLDIYYLSDEEQLTLLGNIDAKPNVRLIEDKYQREILKSLQKSFPFDKFKWDCIRLYRIKEYEVEKRFLWWKWKTIKYEEEKLATLSVDYGRFLNIFHKDFVSAASEKFKKLQEKFKLINEINYYYPVGDLK